MHMKCYVAHLYCTMLYNIDIPMVHKWCPFISPITKIDFRLIDSIKLVLIKSEFENKMICVWIHSGKKLILESKSRNPSFKNNQYKRQN